jgi:hypothetical protein
MHHTATAISATLHSAARLDRARLEADLATHNRYFATLEKCSRPSMLVSIAGGMRIQFCAGYAALFKTLCLAFKYLGFGVETAACAGGQFTSSLNSSVVRN